MLRRTFWPFGNKNDPDCEEVREQASEIIDTDADTPGPLVEKLQRHLAKCRPCNAFVRSLQATVNTLRAMPREGAPDELKERLRRISREEGKRQ